MPFFGGLDIRAASRSSTPWDASPHSARRPAGRSSSTWSRTSARRAAPASFSHPDTRSSTRAHPSASHEVWNSMRARSTSPTARTRKRLGFLLCGAAGSWESVLLRVDNVSFAYRSRRLGAPERHQYVLRDVSFEVGRGAIVGLLGPNGSGKTTLMRLMSGTLTPLAGRVSIEGIDVARLSRRDLARKLAVVPQET